MSWKILTYLTYHEGTLGPKMLKNHENQILRIADFHDFSTSLNLAYLHDKWDTSKFSRTWKILHKILHILTRGCFLRISLYHVVKSIPKSPKFTKIHDFSIIIFYPPAHHTYVAPIHPVRLTVGHPPTKHPVALPEHGAAMQCSLLSCVFHG